MDATRLTVRLVTSLLSALFVAACAAPAPTTDVKREKYEDALSYATWERTRAMLEGISPGTLVTESGIDWSYLRISGRGQEDAYVAVADGWIPPLSGGFWGAINALGHVYGRDADHVYGQHIFGFVYAGELRPMLDVRTRAEIITEAEHQQLENVEDVKTWCAGRPEWNRSICFRNPVVAEVRRLPIAAKTPVESEDIEVREIKGSDASQKYEDWVMTFYMRDSFGAAIQTVEDLPQGSDIYDMIAALDGFVKTTDSGASYYLLMKGFANYDSTASWSEATEDAIYEVLLFGYVEDGKQVHVSDVVFRNGGFVRVVPHAPKRDIVAQFTQ